MSQRDALDGRWNWGLRERFGTLPVGATAPAPKEINREGRPEGCLLDVFDIRLLEVGPGAAVAQMELKDVHMNQRGITQAGAIIAFADAAAGWAAMPALDEGSHFTTLELKANMLRASSKGQTLIATVQPVHIGRSTLILDVLVTPHDSPERLISKFSCTQLVLRAAS